MNLPYWHGEKIEITLTVSYEFELNAENYPEGLTLNEAVALDVQNLREDSVSTIELLEDSSGATFDVEWRKVR